MALDKITVERINTLHPKIRQEVLDMYKHANEKLLGKGIRLRFAYTYRSTEEQDKLYNQKPKVTNAKGWQSIHNYGLAFDIVILYDLDKNGTFETASWDMNKDFDNNKIADWMEVTNYFKSKGYEWGGDWTSFKDAPHFQKTFGLTWRRMKTKIDNSEFVTENNIKYIKV